MMIVGGLDSGRETRSDQAIRVLLPLAILRVSGAIDDRKNAPDRPEIAVQHLLILRRSSLSSGIGQSSGCSQEVDKMCNLYWDGRIERCLSKQSLRGSARKTVRAPGGPLVHALYSFIS